MTWASIVASILGLIKGITGLYNRALDYFREKRLIKTGRELEAAELAKKEIEINREQTEILSQTRTKEETEEKLKHGKF